jgi:hypothetical protein
MRKALGGWVIDRLLPGKLTDFFLLLKSYFHRYFDKIRSKSKVETKNFLKKISKFKAPKLGRPRNN